VKRFIPLILFLLAYIILQIFTFKGYGVSYDEDWVYAQGKHLYQYLFVNKADPNLQPLLLNDFGLTNGTPLFSHIYSLGLNLLNPGGSYDIYHLLNSLFPIFLIISSYLLLYYTYKSSWLSLLGPFFILLTPRFFGHIDINPKDIPFAVLYFTSLVAIYFLSKIQKNTLLRILLFGFLFGLTQSLRFLGLTLYLVLFLFDIYNYFLQKKNIWNKDFFIFLINDAIELAIIFMVSNFILILFWPYIGSNYFKHFTKEILVANKFVWKGFILYFGNKIPIEQSPRLFILVEILLTTPIFILISIFSYFFIKRRKNPAYILLSLALVINVLICLLLHPLVVYRHYLFLTPIISVIAAISFIELFKHMKKSVLKIGLFLIIALNIIFTIIQMVNLYPYNLVYYNGLIGGVNGAEGKFTISTYAIADKEAVEWLRNFISKDNRKKVNVYTCGNPVSSSNYFNKKMELVTDIKLADYVICADKNLLPKTGHFKVIYKVMRDNVALNYVFQKTN